MGGHAADAECRRREIDCGSGPIEEIYEIRLRISARYGNDVRRLGEHYMEYQKQFSDRLISRRDAEAAKTDAPDHLQPSGRTGDDGDPDSVLEEIHATRRRIMAEFGNDRSRYIAHLIELQEQPEYRDRLIRRAAGEEERDPAA